MQMHQIRYFLALCEERNFTRAARRSGVSQPSLTNGIIALERELGGALFQRKPAIASLAAAVLFLLVTVAVTSSVLAVQIANKEAETSKQKETAVAARPAATISTATA